MHNERLCDKQDKDEQQPQADHGLHPPEADCGEALPQIKPPRHVEAGQSDHDDCRARLPNEPMLNRLESA